MVSFHVPGHIQPWQRTTGGRHTPKATREFQAKVRLFARSAGVKCIPKHIAVRLEIEAVVDRPKKSTYPFPTRFDASNVLKSVEDALNHIAYVDDRQVVDTRALKRYTMGNEEQGVDVRIWMLRATKARGMRTAQKDPASPTDTEA